MRGPADSRTRFFLQWYPSNDNVLHDFHDLYFRFYLFFNFYFDK
jgi:hypothetical protein